MNLIYGYIADNALTIFYIGLGLMIFVAIAVDAWEEYKRGEEWRLK